MNNCIVDCITAMSSSILDKINNDSTWINYIQRRMEINADGEKTKRYGELYNDPECRNVVSAISMDTFVFPIPRKKMISKSRLSKKRTVYVYDENIMMGLRLVSDSLHVYDYLFSPNLYSFRRSTGVREAIDKLRHTHGLKKMYGYKTDIHNYFNSIDVDMLISSLEKEIEDEKLLSMFRQILENKKVSYNGEIIEENKGVMAGIPISAFLANYYLKDLDHSFDREDCVYMRYADDIIILASDRAKLDALKDKLLSFLKEKKLELNPAKEHYYQPGEPFEFLGFSIFGNEIDISENTVYKMKGKIRRSCRSIRRWMLKKNAPINGTIVALIRDYNRKFFGYDEEELTWNRWFFPVITTTKGLHAIDKHLQEWIRYIATGKHNKRNYSIVPYKLMKECGYKSLVSEYYKYKRE